MMLSRPTSNNDKAIQRHEEQFVGVQTIGITPGQPDRCLGTVVARQGRRLVPVDKRRGHNIGTDAVDC